MIRSRSVRWLLPFALVVLLSACNNSADEDEDTTLATGSTEAILATAASTTTTEAPTTTTISSLPSGSLSISGSDVAVVCDSSLRQFGYISGAQPGELITFSSPDVSGITPGNANSSGRLALLWFCSPADASEPARITATSASGSSVAFTLYEVARQTITTTTTTPGVDVALPIELSHSQDHSDTAFVAEGEAVDEGAVCPVGTRADTALQSNAQSWITDEEWADMYDSAMAAGIIAEVYVIEEWTCDDGSGAFTVKIHNRFDFSTFEFEGQQNVGTWEITRGDGDYGDRTGSGDVTLDWDTERVIYTGTIQ